jgi:CheY-like chemotaxis protein
MTILYADDDDEDQEVFAEIVQAINPDIQILRARDGLHTMEVLAQCEAPSVIFLDFNMPFLNGHQVLLKLRNEKKYARTRVVIFSTQLYDRAYEELSALNAQYARKPNTLQEGIEALKSIINEGGSAT